MGWRRRRNRRLALAACAAALLAAVLLIRLAPRTPAGGAWVRAARTSGVACLRELGTVVARNETTVLSGFTGEVVWMIEDGTLVQPGTVIVRFNSNSVEQDLERLRKDLLDKEEAVRGRQRELDVVKRREDLAVAKAQAALELARLKRQEVFEQPTPEDRREAQLSLEAARLRQTQAAKQYDAYEELYRRGFVTEAALKQERLKLATAKAEHAKTKTLHDLTLQGATTDSKRLAELAVAEADKSLATANFNRDAENAIAAAGLELAEIELANSKLTIQEKQRQLQEAEVNAPVAGRVAFIDVYKGSRSMSPIQVGESRARGQDLCRIANISALRVKTRVGEADVRKLAAGQPAAVRLPALAGRVFKARVAEISRISQDKNIALSSLALRHAGQAFANVVDVRLDFEQLAEQDLADLRLGLTAEVEVQCSQEVRGPVIRWSAVRFGSDGQTTIQVRAVDGGEATRPVKLGPGDDMCVEVLEGLAEGEEVLDLAGPASPHAGRAAAAVGGALP
jgi:multidrug resistance efflux pump